MQNTRWKKIVFSLILFIFAFILVACGNGSDNGGNDTDTGTETGTETDSGNDTDTSDGEPVEIEFWSFWGGGARRETIEAIIEDFNDSQERIQVSHVYQPWGDIWTKSLAAVTAGNPPNIVVQDINTVRQRADAQQATNIQSYLDEADDNIESRFYPQLWDTVIYEDEAYGLPFNTDTQVLFYNKDMFEEAGLDPEAPPATWAELEEYARQLDDGSGNDWNTIGFYPLWNLGADVWALNADGGVSWFDEEGNVTINTPEKIDALEWILEWQDYYGQDTINQYQAEFGSGVTDPFISRLIPIRGQNINYYTNLLKNAPEDFNFGVAQLPEYEEGNGNWSWGGGFVLEIPYGAEHADESFEFIEYLTSTEVQERFGLASFDIMANAEANENLVTHSELDEEGQMIYELAHLNLEQTLITPVPLTATDFIPLVNGQIDEAMLGNKSAEEALNDAQASVENLVEQNQ